MTNKAHNFGWSVRIIFYKVAFFLANEASTTFGFTGSCWVLSFEKPIRFFVFGRPMFGFCWVLVEMRLFLWDTCAMPVIFALDLKIWFFARTLEGWFILHDIFEEFFLVIKFLKTTYSKLIYLSKR